MIDFFSTPITANFIITRNCNAKCDFCGVSHNRDVFLDDSKKEQIYRIIDILYDNDILRINFFGGEPTVYPFFVDAIQYAKKKSFFNSVVTNGLHVPHPNGYEWISKIDAVAVSIHGLEGDHCSLTNSDSNTYRNVLHNLVYYSNQGVPVTINMTVTPRNYSTIPQFVDFVLEKCTVSAFAFNRFIPSNNVSTDFKKRFVMNIEQINDSLRLIDEAAQRHEGIGFRYAIHFPYCIVENKQYLKYVGNCGFGQNYFSIDNCGNIQACSYSSKVLGNIFEQSLADIWQNNEMLCEYREMKWLPESCKNCEYLLRCGVGCKMTGNNGFDPDLLLEELEVNKV